MNKIKGTGVALVTPFNRNKSVDYTALEKLLNHVIFGGVDYLVVMGTTGESIRLSKDEKTEIIDFCMEFVLWVLTRLCKTLVSYSVLIAL